MSYNPYTRAVKESINVDFEKRYSNQKVILCNRENKFYGTFIGLIKDSQFELSGGTLTDVRLSNVVILDSEGKEINLSRINERLEDIYYNLDVISSSLETTISDTIPAISIELNSAISANSVDISSLFSKLMTLSANSSSGLSNLESYINTNLYNLSSELSTTKQNIKTNNDEIKYISGYIKNLDYEREIPHAHMISSINQVDGKITSFGYRPMETDDISNVALIPDDFSKRFDDRRIRFEYNKEGKMILLGVNTDALRKDNMLSIDCTDFLRDGFLDTIRTGVDDGDPLGQYIELVWNTDALGKESTKIYVRNILSGIYTGVGGVIKVNDYLQISADISALREQIGYNELYNYYEYLAGLSSPADIGEIGRINDKISDLYQIETKNLKFIGHIISPAALSSTTFKNYLENQALCKDFVYNGSFLPVKFLDNNLSISTTDGLTVGNGDIVIIHDHAEKLKINLDKISIGDNVYVVKAGVSRYEYEKTVSKKLKISSDVNEISNWMDDNFVGFLNFESGQITPKKDVILTSNLSVIGTSNVSGNISIYGNMSSYADTYLTHLGSPSVDINNLNVENSIIDHLSVGNLSVNNLTAEFSNTTNLTSDNSNISNLTVNTSNIDNSNIINLSSNNSNISNLNVIDSKISVIDSNVISVKTIYPENLSANSGLLNDGEVAKIITNIIETNGIIDISSEILQQCMISGLTADLGNISTQLDNVESHMLSNDDYLSSHISTKIFVGNYNSNDIKGDYSDLSVLKTTMDEYQQLLIDGRLSTDLSNTIFITTDKNINAFGEKITNLADATELSDAVNLSQLKNISNDITAITEYISSNFDETVENLNLTDNSLSLDISAKIFIDDRILKTNKYGNLSVVKLDIDDYAEILNSSETSSISDIIFIVENDKETAFGNRIQDVEAGINPTDAINLSQLQTLSSGLSVTVDDIANTLDSKINAKVYVGNETSGEYANLSVLKISSNKYQELLLNGLVSSVLSNTLFIVDSDNIDAMGQRIINVNTAIDLSDAVNLEQLNSVESSINSNVQKKSSVSVDNVHSDLNVIHISNDDYSDLLVSDNIDSKTIYIVSSDNFDVFGEQIKNVADATDLSDAVNLGQLKSAQSTSLSEYPNLSSVQWESLSLGEVGAMLKFIFEKLGGLNS